MAEVADHAIVPDPGLVHGLSMDDGAVLYRSSSTNDDRSVVCTNDGPWPDARSGPKADFSDQDSLRMDIRFWDGSSGGLGPVRRESWDLFKQDGFVPDPSFDSPVSESNKGVCGSRLLRARACIFLANRGNKRAPRCTAKSMASAGETLGSVPRVAGKILVVPCMLVETVTQGGTRGYPTPEEN